MDATVNAVIGIDVSNDRLDVHVQPSGEYFTVARAAGAAAPRVWRDETGRVYLGLRHGARLLEIAPGKRQQPA